MRYARQYSEVHQTTGRSVVRHAALSAMYSLNASVGRVERALQRNRVQFLYLHHVFEDEVEFFRLLLRALSETHRFISYSDAWQRVVSGEIDAPYLCLSFDDGVKNCLTAARVMDEFGIKGCFFINSGIVGEENYGRIASFCQRRLHMPPMEFMSWEDLERLHANGHEIGGHTANHVNLAELDDEQAHAEISTCFDALSSRLGEIKHFSWPYGRFDHFRGGQADLVFRAGFSSCTSAERGCHVNLRGKKATEVCLRRDVVVAKWPLSHVLYFLAKNSWSALDDNDYWPYPSSRVGSTNT